MSETKHAEDATNEPENATPTDPEETTPGPEPDSTYRILVAASAKWDNHAAISRALQNWWESNGRAYGTMVIGDTPIGGEPMAMQVWGQVAMPVEMHHADRVSPAARDRGMIASGIDVAFVFIEDNSTGATRVRDLAIAAGIPVIEHHVTHHVPARPWDSQ